ncbi:MAG: hypothetical protein ACE5E3_04425 [Mariprofundus sp.]
MDLIDTAKTENSPWLRIITLLMVLFSLLVLAESLLRQPSAIPEESKNGATQGQEVKESMTRVTVLPDPVRSEPEAESRGKAQQQPESSLSEAHSPAINASFDMPVLDYVNVLKQSAGARIVLFDHSRRRILGSVEKGYFVAGTINTKGMSMRTRNITFDLPLPYRQRITKEAGVSGMVRFLLILPHRSKQKFERLLAVPIEAAGIAWGSVDSLSLRYSKEHGHIVATIQNATSNGKTTRIGKSVQIW